MGVFNSESRKVGCLHGSIITPALRDVSAIRGIARGGGGMGVSLGRLEGPPAAGFLNSKSAYNHLQRSFSTYQYIVEQEGTLFFVHPSSTFTNRVSRASFTARAPAQLPILNSPNISLGVKLPSHSVVLDSLGSIAVCGQRIS